MIQIACLAIVALLAACRGKDAARVATPPLEIPSVTTAVVLAPDDGAPPPPLLVADETGAVSSNAVATWTDVSTKDLRIGAKLTQLPAIARGEPESEAEDDEDDEDDEELAPGTMYQPALGKMGKKESDRAEGQYRMRRDGEREARAQRGPLHRIAARPGDDEPRRAADVAGEIIDDGPLVPLRTLLLVPRTARAARVVEIVAVTSAAIAVAHGGKIRPLRIQFVPAVFRRPDRWLEARVTATDVTIEAVPDVPILVASLDKLAGALDTARTARGTDAKAPVDVLVDASVDAQRLVDVLVALDTAGVRAIGLGTALGPADGTLRGKRFPTVRFQNLSAQGDLDKSEIQTVVTAASPRLLACYTAGLAKDPAIAGTIHTQFFITPLGTVATVSASGVTTEVANCVEGVIKPLVFPKPKGGGGVQVSYPFTMRP